jgi:hypothetical protein
MTLLCENMLVAVQSSRDASGLRLAPCLSIVTLTACDPIVTIAGANLAAIVRPLLVLVRLEPIFYPSLIAMLAMMSG